MSAPYGPDRPRVYDRDGVDRDALRVVLADGGDAPGSRYGVQADEWAPVAVALFAALVNGGAEPDEHTLDGAVSAVVNDRDDVRDMLREYGTDAARELLRDRDAYARHCDGSGVVIAAHGYVPCDADCEECRDDRDETAVEG